MNKRFYGILISALLVPLIPAAIIFGFLFPPTEPNSISLLALTFLGCVIGAWFYLSALGSSKAYLAVKFFALLYYGAFFVSFYASAANPNEGFLDRLLMAGIAMLQFFLNPVFLLGPVAYAAGVLLAVRQIATRLR